MTRRAQTEVLACLGRASLNVLSREAESEVAQVVSQRRRDVARALAWLAGFSATALLVVPKGLALFATLLLASTFLALPDALRADRARLPAAIRGLGYAALAVFAVATVSMWVSRSDISALDNPSRCLLLPWCAWLAWITRVRMSCLWYGALAGLALALVLSVAETWSGVPRVGGKGNPIVFANVVLVLLAIALFTRPARTGSVMRVLMGGAVTAAVVAITLSGSRGVLPGLGLVLALLFVGGARGHRWRRLAMAVGVFVVLFVALWTLPWLSSQFRLDQVREDVAGYATGQVDQPISARLGLLAVAWDAFREAPLTGVGIAGFAQRVDGSRYCLDDSRHFCSLEHAHNEVAQWGATMGLPGVIALLSLYLVPLVAAVREIRVGRSRMPAGASWAVAALVAAYVASGLTQSMFSHAISTSAYVVPVGLLLGMAMAARNAATPAIRSTA